MVYAPKLYTGEICGSYAYFHWKNTRIICGFSYCAVLVYTITYVKSQKVHFSRIDIGLFQTLVFRKQLLKGTAGWDFWLHFYFIFGLVLLEVAPLHGVIQVLKWLPSIQDTGKLRIPSVRDAGESRIPGVQDARESRISGVQMPWSWESLVSGCWGVANPQCLGFMF